MMPKKYCTPEWLSHFAEDFKEPAKKIAAAGKRLMYHNHNIEFQRFHGKLVMDTLLESFSPEELGFTLDTYWVQMGGADVCDWIEKLADRIPCVHLKDMAVKGWEPSWPRWERATCPGRRFSPPWRSAARPSICWWSRTSARKPLCVPGEELSVI